MARRTPRRPFDAWDPYRDDAEPLRRRRRWAWRRLWRLSIPALVALLAFGHDLLKLVTPDRPVPGVMSEPTAALSANRAIRPDPRTKLPRPARAAELPGTWITTEDYPAAALRDRLSGRVGMRFMIEPNGRVRDCVPVTTSGSPLLDTTACGVFSLHARYWPARDTDGRAVAQQSHQTVVWRIPSG